MHIKLPYSQQSGRVPSPDRLKTGELWINGADAIIGTKNNENQVLQYAQLTPEQREHVLVAQELAVRIEVLGFHYF